MGYIKIKTTTDHKSVTIAKAVELSGVTWDTVINSAIARNTLDYGYAFDELSKEPVTGFRPNEPSSKFGNKVVLINDKWKIFMLKQQLKQQAILLDGGKEPKLPIEPKEKKPKKEKNAVSKPSANV